MEEASVFGHIFPEGGLAVTWRRDTQFGTIRAVEESDGSGGRRQWVVKAIRPLPGYDPHQLNDATLAYRECLAAHGVRLPPEYRCFVVEGRFAAHVATYVGEDLRHFLRERPGQAEVELRPVLESIAGVLGQEQPTVGLDPQLSNFGQRGVYIDIFPPILFHQGRWHLHYPEPPAEQVARAVERKCAPFALLRKLRFSFLAIVPDGDTIFTRVVEPFLDGRLAEVRDALAGLPDREIRAGGVSPARICALIEECCQPGQDIETMRELALAVVPSWWPHRERFLARDLFWLSSPYHTPGYPEEYAERLRRLRVILGGCVSGEESALVHGSPEGPAAAEHSAATGRDG